MNWKHVQLIFHREMSDQLRDRRTLFTITILPILLYPLIGMLMMQVAQFNREHSVTIRIIGGEHWPADRPLLTEDGQLAVRPGMRDMTKLVDFETRPWPAGELSLQELQEQATAAIAMDEVDAVLLVQPDFEQRLMERLALDAQSDSAPTDPAATASEADSTPSAAWANNSTPTLPP